MKSNGTYTKLCPVSFGIALGITNGIAMMILAWVSGHIGTGTDVVHLVSTFYAGYSTSIGGGLIGGFWGLVGGFLFGFITVLIYDCCLSCVCRLGVKSKRKEK